MFYLSGYGLKISEIIINFTKSVCSIKDQGDLKYDKGRSVIRYFKDSLIMNEIFSKGKYTDESMPEE